MAPSITTGLRMPATTCALVTMISGASTTAEPSISPPQPLPSIFSVAASPAARAAATVPSGGTATAGAGPGSRPANTLGKPSGSTRRPSRAVIAGTGGR